MTSPARQVLTSKTPTTPSSNGILSIPASATQKGASTTLPSTALHSRASAPRLKVVIRRLAPGLTQDEFEGALGDEWKLGEGKVDWRVFKSGKLSKEYAFSFETTINMHLVLTMPVTVRQNLHDQREPISISRIMPTSPPFRKRSGSPSSRMPSTAPETCAYLVLHLWSSHRMAEYPVVEFAKMPVKVPSIKIRSSLIFWKVSRIRYQSSSPRLPK